MSASSFQARMNKAGLKHIAAIRFAVRRAWESACDHDGIPANSVFVVFSEDNPFVKFHDIALSELRRAKAEYAAGGYVGLTTKRRSL